MTKLTFLRSDKMPAIPKNNITIEEKIDNPSFFLLRDMLPSRLQELLSKVDHSSLTNIEEIRLRINRPVILRSDNREVTIIDDGQVSEVLNKGYVVTSEDIVKGLQIISQSSVYALEEEFRNGFITTKGGFRVGIVGKAVVEKGRVKTLKEINGLNYRVSRELLGIARKVLPYIVDSNIKKIYSTLIISPPQCGKTTLLRDLVRLISDGDMSSNWQGVNVGVVDERSEIAASFMGSPQFQIGLRTDILDSCPKAEGMIMLIRSMSPEVIATDEIGKPEDILAIEEALRAGVSVLTTVHGESYEDVLQRQNIAPLLKQGVFQRVIVMSRSLGVGTIEKIYKGNDLLVNIPFKCQQ